VGVLNYLEENRVRRWNTFEHVTSNVLHVGAVGSFSDNLGGEICYYDSLNNTLCYYRTPNVSIVIIGFQTLRPCYYRILASFNLISASNTCIWDMK
jgi:hypothetical protein